MHAWALRLALGGLVGACQTAGTDPAPHAECVRETRNAGSPPNIVVLFADDMGWGDVGCYEGSQCQTPNIDRLAREGLRLTSFYVAAPACSPSRAALLTGCYPVRVGVPEVLGPKSPTGLAPSEETLAELLRERGYTTAMVGKWHLGDAPAMLPTAQGFDSWTGLPYSNDMWPWHYGDPERGVIGNPNWPDLPLFDGGQVTQLNPNQDSLTPLYTKRALEFLDAHVHAQGNAQAASPFFLYYAFSHPHVPIAASERFRGKSGQGLYADMILEIDDAVGQVVAKLEELGLAQNTWVVFTSDNGPWTRFGDHAGTTGPWRGDKGTCFEGGMRMPCVVWAPGQMVAGRTSDQVTTAMDLVPTVAALTGARLPSRPIDGVDQSALWTGRGELPIPGPFFYYYPSELHAVRVGRWKLHAPHPFRKVVTPGQGGYPGEQTFVQVERSLYDLEADPGETTNVAASHPEIVRRLERELERARVELGDSLVGRKGRAVRPAGKAQ
ncbi:MAG: sulfatase [Planctomycetes bacterium]|nr:sulfatase [Planctomycetota bacterium]MCB9910160.1 sulfatase [Planctomycetota bacterium]